jgi:hypothetical protein
MIKDKCLTERERLKLGLRVKKLIEFKVLAPLVEHEYSTLRCRFNGYLKFPEKIAEKINCILDEIERKRNNENVYSK